MPLSRDWKIAVGNSTQLCLMRMSPRATIQTIQTGPPNNTSMSKSNRMIRDKLIRKNYKFNLKAMGRPRVTILVSTANHLLVMLHSTSQLRIHLTHRHQTLTRLVRSTGVQAHRIRQPFRRRVAMTLQERQLLTHLCRPRLDRKTKSHHLDQ